MMTATLSIGGVVGSATPAASAWVKSADPWPPRISVLHPALGRAGAERFALSWVCSALSRRARRWGCTLLAVITYRPGAAPDPGLALGDGHPGPAAGHGHPGPAAGQRKGTRTGPSDRKPS